MNQALLDTNILSYFLRGNTSIVSKFKEYRQFYPHLSFSIFTYYEIKSGLLYRDAQRQLNRFEQLAEISEVVGRSGKNDRFSCPTQNPILEKSFLKCFGKV